MSLQSPPYDLPGMEPPPEPIKIQYETQDSGESFAWSAVIAAFFFLAVVIVCAVALA
ncbi:hypothetical protein JRC04_04700 [Mycolicibacterium sp. S2-37]|uniref:hypothetical protein n=1 Tax=Mycolicibacterium sp. S2-37 TaxID=2810297 RepID=UPI001A94F4E2|nr:hypothetical protein [Mycolicibacterium sp. S2-37]MBO0676758.1 hypothetical protein [Mycolicibacterium sp. S2-37]